MVWCALNAFIRLLDRNQEGIPKDTLWLDDVIEDMTSMSKLSTLEHPRTGGALFMQLLSVSSHTREKTPRYFAGGGGKAAGRLFNTTVYVFARPNSSTGSNVVMMQFGGGVIKG